MKLLIRAGIWIFISFITFITTSSWTIANEKIDDAPYLYTAKPQNGDGIHSFLRRYFLLNHECNLDAFYELNKMTSKSDLLRHKKYKLPIYIYQYNGKSIRSTINDLDMDKALRIQSYNRKLLKNNIRKKAYEQSKILWVPYNELNCITSNNNITNTLSKIEKNQTLTIALFGEEKNVIIKSNKLKDQVYYVVSGHGGPDPGAMALNINQQHDLCEDEYAYDVSLRLAKKLMENGALVHIIIQDKNDGIRKEEYLDCDKDETCMGQKIPLSQVRRLRQRTKTINKLYKKHTKTGITKQKVICIHVDSRSVYTNQDVFFYYYKKSKSGKNIAYNLHRTFKQKYQKYQKGRGYFGTVSERPLYVLKNTSPPAVYVELANIKNRKDRLRLIKSSNRQALADWLYDGLIQ